MMWLGLVLKIGLPLLIAGGAYLWINNAAYNRGYTSGVSDTTEHMKKAIAKQKADVAKDIERLKTMPRGELEKELEKRCREAGGGDACRN